MIGLECFNIGNIKITAKSLIWPLKLSEWLLLGRIALSGF